MVKSKEMDKVVEEKVVKWKMSMSEIKDLPNMLGVIAAAMVGEHGEYRCEVGGEKVLIVLA